MQFASPLPWWLAVLVAAAVVAAAYWTYRRPAAPLTGAQRAALMSLRTLSLAAIVIFLCRPVTLMPNAAANAVVPVLVDVSRSMRVADVDGGTRASRASQIVADLWPSLSQRFTPELFGVGDGLTALSSDQLHADDRRSDIDGSLASVRARYRGRSVPGVVLISDGVHTSSMTPAPQSDFDPYGMPVYAVSIGSATAPDREVVAVVAGDPRLGQASVDLRVTAVSRGLGRAPFEIRLSANGILVDTRTVTPAVDGSPVTALFAVSPDPVAGAVYTASIPAEADELVVENNSAGALISPAGRSRRVLALYGAPGYDHSFLLRALGRDVGLQIDVVVRKGRDETGAETFLIQAAPGRGAALATGFPATREALFVYDAVLLGNIEAGFLTGPQLSLLADFVAVRGGGLIVSGSRSFVGGGFIGTPLEEVLPLALDERTSGLSRELFDTESAPAQYGVGATSEGVTHPVMRIGASPAETLQRWANVPPLAGVSALGGPRPGAAVLAVTTTPNGSVSPLVAVQRYGAGRSLVFPGEASWRWRMLLPATDRTYDSFWRQAVRWVAAPAPEMISFTVSDAPEPGEAVRVVLDVRDREFRPAAGATVEARLTRPAGGVETLALQPDPGAQGTFTGSFTPSESGPHRVEAEARLAATTLGTADRWFLVGASDREFADPRVNDAYLRRLALASGGAFVRSEEAGSIPALLNASSGQGAPPVLEDLWDRPVTFGLVVAMLAAEWMLRRRWGLR
jgi:uncharacterized membrane protein